MPWWHGTGKHFYYFKAGVDLATGKPYQERRRGFKPQKKPWSIVQEHLTKVQQRRELSIPMDFASLWKKFYAKFITPQQVRTSWTQTSSYIDEFIQYFGKKT